MHPFWIFSSAARDEEKINEFMKEFEKKSYVEKIKSSMNPVECLEEGYSSKSICQFIKNFQAELLVYSILALFLLTVVVASIWGLYVYFNKKRVNYITSFIIIVIRASRPQC